MVEMGLTDGKRRVPTTSEACGRYNAPVSVTMSDDDRTRNLA